MEHEDVRYEVVTNVDVSVQHVVKHEGFPKASSRAITCSVLSFFLALASGTWTAAVCLLFLFQFTVVAGWSYLNYEDRSGRMVLADREVDAVAEVFLLVLSVITCLVIVRS